MPEFRLVVLISGGGTTLRNLLERQAKGELLGQIVHVVSSRFDAGGLNYAKEHGVRASVIDPRQSQDLETFSHAIFELCRSVGANLVVMGGFLKQVLIPIDFENKVVNIHPSLIPAFCGRGMYGQRVHTAVIDYGCKLTGCTVHFVDNEYDHGPIIAQTAVPVEPDDTPETLARRVFEVECELYPSTINALASAKVKIDGRLVEVK